MPKFNYSFCEILGIGFFSGTIGDCLLLAKSGKFVVAPSGPCLAKDLDNCISYQKSLLAADIVLPDSGLLCLFQKWINGITIKRISGLKFLKYFLKDYDSSEPSIWVMPNEYEANANREWLLENHNINLKSNEIYCAPIYESTGAIFDDSLLHLINEIKPKTIFIQLGGGVQERLGLFLKQNLNYEPTILCTGAALAFLSGQQARIPSLIDHFYLGWLMRCFSNPKLFLPRYLRAFRLIYLLFKYGNRLPEH